MVDVVCSVNPATIMAAVLAGGKSTRMGQDKCTLLLNGKSLLEKSIATFQQCDLQHICVSGGNHASCGLDTVEDIFPDSGPLGAIHALLVCAQQSGFTGIICVAVDMPLITQAALSTLITTHRSTGENVHFEGHPLPCVLGVSAHHIDVAEEILKQRSNLSLRHFYQKIGCRTLPADSLKKQLYNANTPEDWRALPQLIGVNH